MNGKCFRVIPLFFVMTVLSFPILAPIVWGQSRTGSDTSRAPYDSSYQPRPTGSSSSRTDDPYSQTRPAGSQYRPPYGSSSQLQPRSVAPGVSPDLLRSYDRLSDLGKVRFFLNMSDADKVRFFLSLRDYEQSWLFSELSDEEQMNLFWLLGNTERVAFFSMLNDEEKYRLFSRMKEPEKQAFFLSLGNRDRRVLFERLSEDEKKRWMEQYPEIEGFAAGREIPPRPFEKAPARPLEEVEKAKRPSGIEQIMSGEFPQDISRELRQFGYEFFERELPNAQPLTALPVGPDYVIGPNDSFTINLWGKTEGTYDVTVGRDGTITLPRVGTLVVSGLNFAQLKQHLFKKFKEYYPEFDMSITMGRLRTVDVFVVGEVRYPGTYALSSLSTVITALSAAGGPTKQGSLRKIQLSRIGEAARVLDLYEFFVEGNRGNDLRLHQGDTILVPVLGSVAGIAGCVRRPAIYEVKGGETIGDMIELAGGILPIGHTQNIVIERVMGHERRVINSFNLNAADFKTDPNIRIGVKDFDLIKVFPVHERMQQVVYLEGHVKYPREYELKPGMRLRDLIPSYDVLLPEAYLPEAEIIRLVPPDLHPEIIMFNLRELLAGVQSQNLPLKDLDRVIVYETWEKQQKPEVTIKGAVRNPGTYRLYQGMTVRDLIFQAGNFTDSAFAESASLTRIVKGEKGTDTVKMAFSPRKAMEGFPEDNHILQNKDWIFIRSIPQYSEALERKVYLEGEFLFPGEYAFSEGERLTSVIQRAHGLTQEAYPLGAVFQRESVKKVQEDQLKRYLDKLEEDILTLTAQSAETSLDSTQAAIVQQMLSAKRQLLERMRTAQPTGRMVINVPDAMEKPSSQYDVVLRPGDRLIVKKRPDTVVVMGEVYNPTALLFEEAKAVSYYLRKVGGPTDTAEEDEMYVVKANGSVISKKQEGSWGNISWDTDNSRWVSGSFESLPLDPGDTIIVPKKVQVYPWLRIVKDVTQIAYQIAVAAGTLIIAF